jgi:putative resolvase
VCVENTYSIGQFAQLTGRGVKTLQKWDRAGILKAHRTPTGRRYYTHDQYLEYRGLKAQGTGSTIAYARVSTPAQKPDLQNQMAALRAYCQAHAIAVNEWVDEIGSGLNYQRKQFIAHKDRLVRFGFEWFAAFCQRHGTELVIVNGDTLSPEQELVQDLLSIVHIFSARLYGLSSYKKVLRDAALQKDQTPG